MGIVPFRPRARQYQRAASSGILGLFHAGMPVQRQAARIRELFRTGLPVEAIALLTKWGPSAVRLAIERGGEGRT
jgi:hypothetical protein